MCGIFQGKIYKHDPVLNMTTVFYDKVQVCRNIAIDWVAYNLYYADMKDSSICACSLRTAMCTSIIKGSLDQPQGLAVDPLSG